MIMRIRTTILAFCLVCISLKASALEDWEYSSTTYSQESLVNAVPDFVKTPEGGLSWQVLATTKEKEMIVGKVEEGDLISIRPEFTDEVRKLDKQTVVMQGYMFPLEQSEQQAKFLFGPFPMSCPYHYHVGPSMVIEAHPQTPITFTFDALTLKGTLELVPADDEYNVFYRLKDASVIPLN